MSAAADAIIETDIPARLAHGVCPRSVSPISIQNISG
jgi:hypothetical protein